MKITRYLTNLDSFIAACIGFYAIYIYTSYSGVGLSPDSIMYASAADSFQAHGNMMTFNKTPITFFPVFYPFFLGVIEFFSRINPMEAGAMINRFLFAGVIFTSGWIMERFMSHSRIYKWLVLIAIILSPALLEIYSYLWSETLFILEILFFIIAWWKYTHTHSIRMLMIAAIITAISCITRYAGVTIVATGGLLILLDYELTIRKKISHLFLYGFVSVSLLAGNLLMNAIATGLSTGTREPSVTPFFKNLYYVGTVINDWGSLSDKADAWAVPITSVILLALIAILAWKTWKRRINSYENIVIAFALVYALFIIVSASITRYETIDSRLLAPVFIPLLISCTSWVPDVLKDVRKKPLRYSLAGVAIIAMLLFEYSTVMVDYQRWYDEDGYGVPGYSDDSWNKSEFAPYLKAHKNMFDPKVPIFSDANEAVYLCTGLSSKLVPHKYFKNKVNDFYQHKHFYVVWFDSLYNSELISLKNIMLHKKLQQLVKKKEGEVYLCNEK